MDARIAVPAVVAVAILCFARPPVAAENSAAAPGTVSTYYCSFRSNPRLLPARAFAQPV
jgi:hypothetical protein